MGTSEIPNEPKATGKQLENSFLNHKMAEKNMEELKIELISMDEDKACTLKIRKQIVAGIWECHENGMMTAEQLYKKIFQDGFSGKGFVFKGSGCMASGVIWWAEYAINDEHFIF